MFPATIGLVGGGRRGSRTSVIIMFSLGGDVKDDTRSPGCLPMIVSSATTPKL
ncbi:hypothetical protein RHMOL_Rhmol10G0044900 [Rhododendron molle]|uniref:Uncharacterized protein n=1 Tax=Rhododendron molle TaxID=49168 RepID=A0ACC0LYK6_RHOML|nr:hypothetical protein RHMOL_Rhmol10G0044900 [Rhododendron molle]